MRLGQGCEGLELRTCLLDFLRTPRHRVCHRTGKILGMLTNVIEETGHTGIACANRVTDLNWVSPCVDMVVAGDTDNPVGTEADNYMVNSPAHNLLPCFDYIAES
jgi:hypothetical protein